MRFSRLRVGFASFPSRLGVRPHNLLLWISSFQKLLHIHAFPSQASRRMDFGGGFPYPRQGALREPPPCTACAIAGFLSLGDVPVYRAARLYLGPFNQCFPIPSCLSAQHPFLAFQPAAGELSAHAFSCPACPGRFRISFDLRFPFGNKL